MAIFPSISNWLTDFLLLLVKHWQTNHICSIVGLKHRANVTIWPESQCVLCLLGCILYYNNIHVCMTMWIYRFNPRLQSHCLDGKYLHCRLISVELFLWAECLFAPLDNSYGHEWMHRSHNWTRIITFWLCRREIYLCHNMLILKVLLEYSYSTSTRHI